MDKEKLQGRIFKHLDASLGRKLNHIQAKNHKKLLAAIQKARLLTKVEMKTLFDKADRFLDKKSMGKVKEEIKTQTKLKYMAMDHHEFEERQ